VNQRITESRRDEAEKKAGSRGGAKFAKKGLFN